MNLLPFKRIEICSEKSRESFLADLKKDWIVRNGFEKSSESLLGFIGSNNFKLSRDIAYRNSFLPVAVGGVVENDGSLTVRILMRPPMFSFLFFVLWLSLLLVFAVLVFVKDGANSMSFVALALIAFGYGVVQFCFWLESPKLERIFLRIAKS